MPSVSVIICTHNPRPDYLARVLAALRGQTLAPEQWSLLMIDNRSDEPLAARLDLSWHPRARIVREETPGLASARLRGIREAEGELLVFVDDDNILAPDYLAAAWELFSRRTDLGAASGRLLPEYETAPPSWFQGEYESWLAIRRLEKSVWSNFPDARSEPAGAGLCLRASIAQTHAAKAAQDRYQLLLGRRGASLMSGEDVALIKTALAGGYSVGQFVELNLAHLIPARRVTPEYLFSLYRHMVASGRILGWMDTPPHQRQGLSPVGAMKELYRFTLGGPLQRRLVLERFQGRRLARRLLAAVDAAPT
jgi:glycosyltransferase involved in cell wall biosynthesis